MYYQPNMMILKDLNHHFYIYLKDYIHAIHFFANLLILVFFKI